MTRPEAPRKVPDYEHVKQLAQDAVMSCVAVRARMVSRTLTNMYNEALRPHQIRITQRAILAVLTLQGDITPKQLSKLMMIEASTVSRNVERMKNMGWLETKDTNDGRSHVIVVTDAGRALLLATEAPWLAVQQEAESIFGQDTITQMCGAADRMWAAEQAEAQTT